MKKIRRLIAASIVFAACTQIDVLPEQPAVQEARLQIEVSAEEATKGLVTGNLLPNGSVIGVALYGPNGQTYAGKFYSRTTYVAKEFPGGQIWTRDPDIFLTEEVGTLYAYYPYSTSFTNIRSIFVQTNNNNQDDVMYATPVHGLDIDHTHARLTMNHALAAIRLSVSRGTYEGAGQIRQVGVGGKCGGTSGYLDATTGQFSDIIKGSVIYPTTPFTLSDEPNIQDFLLIPTGEPGELIVKMTIDEVIYTLNGIEILLEQGKITNLDIKVDKGKLSLNSVKLTDWRAYNKGEYSAPTDFNVNIEGDTDGLSFTTSVADNGDVTIIAIPYVSKYAEVNLATVEGDATVTQTIDEVTGNLTIVLSEMNSSCTVSFNGYTLWLAGEYNVTSTDNAIALFSNGYNPKFTRMKVDGTEVPLSRSYTFSTIGTHEVRFGLSDPTRIMVGSFHSTYGLTSLTVPEGVTVIDYWAFASCSQLKEISLPSTLKSIEWESFKSCSSLESVLIPDGCTIGYGAFSRCDMLSAVRLPADMKTINHTTFYYCTSLEEIDIPESVNKIGYRAFNGSGLTSVHVPDGVTVLEWETFSTCQKLKELRLPSGLTEIQKMALNHCPALEVITFSDGTSCTDEFIIPEGVTTLGEQCLNTKSLRSIVIPESVVNIEPGGLSSVGVESFTMTGNNPMYDLRNNSVIETATNKLVGACSSSTKIHDSVTTIGEKSFKNLEIDTIDIPATVSVIETQAFLSTMPSTIISRALTPPTLGAESFWVAKYYGILKVPAAALDAYKTEWMKTDVGYLGNPTARWTIQSLADGE